MKVERILAQKGPDVYSIQSNARVIEAVNLMNQKHIGALVVLDENQNIAGIVTERDILWAVPKKDFQDMPAKDIMTPKDRLISGSKDNDLRYVMSVMSENRIRHLPILDNGKLVALISIRDVIKALLESAEFEKQVMNDYISGTDLG